jgi:hypothetical protein
MHTKVCTRAGLRVVTGWLADLQVKHVVPVAREAEAVVAQPLLVGLGPIVVADLPPPCNGRPHSNAHTPASATAAATPHTPTQPSATTAATTTTAGAGDASTRQQLCWRGLPDDGRAISMVEHIHPREQALLNAVVVLGTVVTATAAVARDDAGHQTQPPIGAVRLQGERCMVQQQQQQPQPLNIMEMAHDISTVQQAYCGGSGGPAQHCRRGAAPPHRPVHIGKGTPREMKEECAHRKPRHDSVRLR